jgi:hypothetical protein
VNQIFVSPGHIEQITCDVQTLFLQAASIIYSISVSNIIEFSFIMEIHRNST